MENVFKMFARMPASLIGGADWYINQNVWPQIFQLHLVIGTGGAPLFIPSGSLADGPNGTLLGRPIQAIEQASTLGDVGDISFLNLGEYLLARKASGVKTATSIHVAFDTDETAFRWTLRVDGCPRWKEPVTPAHGAAGETVSPFVTLQAR